MTLETLLPKLEFAHGMEDAVRGEISRSPERIRRLAAGGDNLSSDRKI